MKIQYLCLRRLESHFHRWVPSGISYGVVVLARDRLMGGEATQKNNILNVLMAYNI